MASMTTKSTSGRKRTAELELGSLVLPEADAAAEAGKLISELQKLWSGANLQERRKLLMTMLDAVYVDSSENTIVAIKPKAPFQAGVRSSDHPGRLGSGPGA